MRHDLMLLKVGPAARLGSHCGTLTLQAPIITVLLCSSIGLCSRVHHESRICPWVQPRLGAWAVACVERSAS